jgi:hypothetical protein
LAFVTGPTSTTTRLISFRGLAAAGIVFAGAVHLLLAVLRAGGWRAEAVGFAAVGIIQLVVCVWWILSSERVVSLALLAAALVPATTWLVTRTVGYPFGPWQGLTLEIHGLELLVVAGEVVAGLIAVITLTPLSSIVPGPGLRLDTVAPVLFVLAGVPGMVGIEAVDTYLVEPTGQTHTHAAVVAG